MRYAVRIVIISAIEVLAGCHDSASPSQTDVYIFAGQSNIAGADAIIDPLNGVEDLAQVGEQTDADRAAVFTFAELPTVTYPWGDIRGHNGGYFKHFVNAEGYPYKVIGPEVGFSRAFYAIRPANITIMSASANFSALENGQSPWVKPGSLWTELTAFIDARLEDLKAQGKEYHIKGFVWAQGIDDAFLHRDQDSYTADLRQIIADLRERYADSETPFILMRDPDADGMDIMGPIRAAQVEVAQTTPHSAWINIDDLQLVDVHHLTAASQLKVGARYADAWPGAVAP